MGSAPCSILHCTYAGWNAFVHGMGTEHHTLLEAHTPGSLEGECTVNGLRNLLRILSLNTETLRCSTSSPLTWSCSIQYSLEQEPILCANSTVNAWLLRSLQGVGVINPHEAAWKRVWRCARAVVMMTPVVINTLAGISFREIC